MIIEAWIRTLANPMHRVPPRWRLPEGVNGPLWEYTHTPRLAVEEDAYFAGHPLFEVDGRLLESQFTAPGRLIDLGCGAGRHTLRFAGKGFRVVAVDLSRPMLQTVQRKALELGLESRVYPLEANLCDLGCLANESFDFALSMFSTLGMIRGRAPRHRALAEITRVLRTGGHLALHAHNFWLNLRGAQGRLWLLGQLGRTLRFRDDVGDRRMTYRGIPGMEVHLYRWGELKRDILRAGLVIDNVIALEDVSYRPMDRPWLLPHFRPGGWVVFAHRP